MMNDMYACVCRYCKKWHSHIIDGVCVECLKDIREGKLLPKNSQENLKAKGVYY